MKARLRRILPVLILVVVAGSLLWFKQMRDSNGNGALAVSGTVEATESHLGFQASGRIEAIWVREGDATAAGQELAALDRTEALARRDQAQAQIGAARAGLRELQQGARPEELAQARSAENAARIRLEDAVRDRERTERLQQGGAVSMEALDKARTAEALVRSQHEQVADQLALVERGARQERIDAQQAALEAAEASLRVVEAMLANMTLVAQGPAVVTVRHHEPGEIVGPGVPVLTLMDRADRWVRIFVSENQIGAVSLGQRATISSDTYADRVYDGEVTFISSQAEFTPKNVQTAEERVKLVYAVKVRVTGDPGFELKPGMPADVFLEMDGT